MHHLLEHINQDIKKRSSKDKDSTVHKTEYQSKKCNVKPGGPDSSQSILKPFLACLLPKQSLRVGSGDILFSPCVHLTVRPSD